MWSRTLVVLQETLASVMGRSPEEVIAAVVAAAVDQLWPSTALHGWTVTDQLAAPLRADVKEMTTTAVEAVAVALQGLGDRAHPKNARLAAYLAIHMVTNLTRVTVRDHPEAIRSGEFTAEITRMVTRYLLVK